MHSPVSRFRINSANGPLAAPLKDGDSSSLDILFGTFRISVFVNRQDCEIMKVESLAKHIPYLEVFSG